MGLKTKMKALHLFKAEKRSQTLSMAAILLRNWVIYIVSNTSSCLSCFKMGYLDCLVKKKNMGIDTNMKSLRVYKLNNDQLTFSWQPSWKNDDRMKQ